MVVEHNFLRIAQILLRQSGKQLHRPAALAFSGGFGKKRHYLPVISARSLDIILHIRIFISVGTGKLRNHRIVRESGYISVANGVLQIETTVVLRTLLSRDFRQIGSLRRWNNVNRKRQLLAYPMLQIQDNFLILTERHFLQPETSVLHRQHNHISQSG